MIRTTCPNASSLILAATLLGGSQLAGAQDTGLPDYLADRGDAIRTSLLATYIRPREFIFYPFYEYTRTSNIDVAMM
ncbi:MAG: hypothetical protein ABL878_05520 [Burkholderiales bacterium]